MLAAAGLLLAGLVFSAAPALSGIVVINNESAPPNAANVIDADNSYPGTSLAVHGPTVVELVGGGLIGGDFIVREPAEITISGGTVGHDVVSSDCSTVNIHGGVVTNDVEVGNSCTTMVMTGGFVGGSINVQRGSADPGPSVTISGGSIAGDFDDQAEGGNSLSNVFIGGNLRSTNAASVTVTNSTITGDVFVAMDSHITLTNVIVGGEIILSDDCDSCGVTVLAGPDPEPEPIPPVTPVGPEFQVNSYTIRDQQFPAVSHSPNGHFVVVWESDGSAEDDDSNDSIHGQLFDTTATPVGAEFQVNTYTTGAQWSPAVSHNPNGDFVVVWESLGSAGSDTFGFSIQRQHFDATGAPVGVQFQVNLYTTGGQVNPAISHDADGNFVIAWQSFGSFGGDTSSHSIQAQRYDALGAPEGSQFQVNTYTSFYQRVPSVSHHPNGDFVIVWESPTDGGGQGREAILGQRYDTTGAPLGSEFRIDGGSTASHVGPSISHDANGNSVVVWDRGLPVAVEAQRFDTTGAPLGSQFRVDSSTNFGGTVASVSHGADGDFVVVWQNRESTGSDTDASSIQGRRFDAMGAPVGDDFQVNSTTRDEQVEPAVSHDPDGNFVVVWQSDRSLGSDNYYRSIQGQRYVPEPDLGLLQIGAIGSISLLARRRSRRQVGAA